jgi:hypothetical protein
MNDRLTIEKYLFDWDGWDEVGTMELQFYNVVLKVPIGEFPVGTKFQCATISCEASVIQLFETDTKYHEFELNFVVGAKLLTSES